MVVLSLKQKTAIGCGPDAQGGLGDSDSDLSTAQPFTSGKALEKKEEDGPGKREGNILRGVCSRAAHDLPRRGPPPPLPHLKREQP